MNLSAELIAETNTYQGYVSASEVNPYNGSSLQLFQQMSSKKKGAAFEHLITEVLRRRGYDVTKPSNSDHDRIINGKKVEIKGSLGWVTNGVISHYRFQQIRQSQDYEIVLFAFFTPDGLVLKGCTKQTAMEHLSIQDDEGNFPHNQHGGKRVNSGTFCIDCQPDELDWMLPIEEMF
jgi:hypothetical protein